MSSKPRDGDFKMTVEEAERLKEALKKEEFRKLLVEYASEISDPENKKRYEEEITELEKRRGMDVKFVNPTPGFVMKTVLLPENKKAFVNICQSDTIAKATVSKPARKRRGEHWNIPFSLSPPREDLDKAKKKCMVYDAIFNPETYKKGQENPRFKQLLIDTALDAIENELGDKLDRQNIKYLLMPYKGMALPTVIRSKGKKPPEQPSDDLPFKVPYPPLKEELEAKSHKKQQQQKQQSRAPNEPKYTITHRGEFSIQDFTHARESTRVRRPKELLVTVELPGMESARGMELDIFEKCLLLQCSKPDYKLDLALPYPIDVDKGSAQFDKRRQCLAITLCVLPQKDLPAPVKPLITEIHPESANMKSGSQSHDLGEHLTNGNAETPSSASEESVDETVPDSAACDGPTSSETEDSNSQSTQETGAESSSDHMTQPWSTVGAWHCPRFSHRQDEEFVSFVLHTPGAKAQTLVQHFDQNQFQLTYQSSPTSGDAASGCGQGYSLFVRFPESHTLSPENSKVDISEENVVVVVKKTPESMGVWDKFEVGPTAEETTEKLFLTEANVQSVIEEAETSSSPWVTAGRSKDTELKVVSVSDDHLEVKLCDPQEGFEQKTPTSQIQVEPQEPSDTQIPQEKPPQNPPDPHEPQAEQQLPTTQETVENPQQLQDNTLKPQEAPQESEHQTRKSRDDPQEPQEKVSSTQNIEQEPTESQKRQPEDTTAAIEPGCQNVTAVETSESGTRQPAEIVTSGDETQEDRDTTVTPRDQPSDTREGTTPVTDSGSQSVNETPSMETTDTAELTASQTEVEAPPKSYDVKDTAVCSKQLPETASPPCARVVVQEDGSVLLRVKRTGRGTEKQIKFSNKLVFDLD